MASGSVVQRATLLPLTNPERVRLNLCFDDEWEPVLCVPIHVLLHLAKAPLKWLRFLGWVYYGATGDLKIMGEDGKTLAVPDYRAVSHLAVDYYYVSPRQARYIDGKLLDDRTSVGGKQARGNFATLVGRRDGAHCVVRQNVAEYSKKGLGLSLKACHLIPHSKKDSYIENLNNIRSIHPDDQLSGIDDPRNGLNVWGGIHGWLGTCIVAFLLVPNIYLDIEDIDIVPPHVKEKEADAANPVTAEAAATHPRQIEGEDIVDVNDPRDASHPRDAEDADSANAADSCERNDSGADAGDKVDGDGGDELFVLEEPDEDDLRVLRSHQSTIDNGSDGGGYDEQGGQGREGESGDESGDDEEELYEPGYDMKPRSKLIYQHLLIGGLDQTVMSLPHGSEAALRETHDVPSASPVALHLAYGAAVMRRWGSSQELNTPCEALDDGDASESSSSLTDSRTRQPKRKRKLPTRTTTKRRAAFLNRLESAAVCDPYYQHSLDTVVEKTSVAEEPEVDERDWAFERILSLRQRRAEAELMAAPAVTSTPIPHCAKTKARVSSWLQQMNP
ncbi:hypothetical protein C8R47DRAFT_1154543 [Mycena vitilis]|nr:hypothetical protein C8R47DRAFT_1154543 [Mycena vitilis]